MIIFCSLSFVKLHQFIDVTSIRYQFHPWFSLRVTFDDDKVGPAAFALATLVQKRLLTLLLLVQIVANQFVDPLATTSMCR